MMVEDKPDTEKLKEQRDEENGVRRITSLEDSKPGAKENFDREAEFRRKRPGIFDQITESTRSFPRAVTIDVNPLKNFVAVRTRMLSLGADHRNQVAGIAKRAGLAPHTPIERHGQIFHDDAYGGRIGARHGLLFRRNSLSAAAAC